MESTSPQRQAPVLAGLIAFGVLAIVLGVFNLKRTIRPTRGPAVNLPAIPRTREELEAQQRAALSSLDTDHDGLDDLTELEWTRTSPFLPDSDSDGRTDKEEVDAGEDPNCPKDKVCVVGPRPEEDIPRAQPLIEPTPLLGPLGSDLGQPAQPSPVPRSASNVGSLSAPELREALLRQGLSAEVIQQFSDQQLTETFGSLLNAVTQRGEGNADPSSDPVAQSFITSLLDPAAGASGAIDALPRDPASIRMLLEKSGIPRERLRQLDDRTLLAVWQQVLEELRKQQGTTLP